MWVPLLLKLFVIPMPIRITPGLFLQTFSQRIRQIDTSLVGQTDQNEEHIRHFLSWVGLLFAFLERLLAVSPRHDPTKLADFLVQEDGIGEWIEVSNPCCIDPLIDCVLCFLNSHDR